MPTRRETSTTSITCPAIASLTEKLRAKADTGLMSLSPTDVTVVKPLHMLRKSCLREWAARFPMHVVQAWAGRSNISITATFYLQVSEPDYEKAGAKQMAADLPRILPRIT